MSTAAIRMFPERGDVWRADGAAAKDASLFKEWQHFALFANGLDLLVNFSLDQRAGARTSRVIVMAKSREWHGALDTTTGELSPDGRRATFGSATMDIRDGTYRVRVDWPEHDIDIDVTFRPLTTPMYAAHRPMADGRRLHWALIARLEASGTVHVGNRDWPLSNAPSYHDHNWGSFGWGSDFSWEWGSVLPDDPRSPWSCVFSRVTNRARTVIRSQHLFVWRGARNVLAAESEGVATEARGRVTPPAHPFRIPAEMALIDGRRDVDLPSLLEIVGRAGADIATLRFTTHDTGRILVPSEHDPLGKVVIHECLGDAAAHGEIAGESFQWGGRGVFELLRD